MTAAVGTSSSSRPSAVSLQSATTSSSSCHGAGLLAVAYLWAVKDRMLASSSRRGIRGLQEFRPDMRRSPSDPRGHLCVHSDLAAAGSDAPLRFRAGTTPSSSSSPTGSSPFLTSPTTATVGSSPSPRSSADSRPGGQDTRQFPSEPRRHLMPRQTEAQPPARHDLTQGWMLLAGAGAEEARQGGALDPPAGRWPFRR